MSKTNRREHRILTSYVQAFVDGYKWRKYKNGVFKGGGGERVKRRRRRRRERGETEREREREADRQTDRQRDT